MQFPDIADQCAHIYYFKIRKKSNRSVAAGIAPTRFSSVKKIVTN